MKHGLLLLCLLLQISISAQKPELVVPIGHTDFVISVAMSPDGKYILTGGKGRAFNLWNREGQIIRRVAGHLGSINTIAFSPDGQKILTGTSDATSKLWNLNGDSLRTFRDPDVTNRFHIFDLAFSPTGDTILTVGGSRALLWNLQGEVIKELKDEGMRNIKAAAFSPNGRHVLLGSNSPPRIRDPEGNLHGPKGSRVRLWDLKTGGEPKRFSNHEAIVHSVAFSPDGKTFLSASEDKQVLVRTLAGEILHQRKWEKWDRLYAACFSPDGKQVLLSGRGVERWDLASNGVRSYSAHDELPHVYAVAFSPDGQQILAGCHHNTAHLWDLDGTIVQTFQGSSAAFSEAQFSPDGTSILSGSSQAYLWNLEDRRVDVLSGHEAAITAVAYSADGQTLLTSSKDHTARSWDSEGTALTTFAGDLPITSIGISQNGQSILTSYEDGSAALWNRNGIKNQNIRLKNSRHPKNQIRTVALSPNGQHFFLGGEAFRSARLYDSTGKEIVEIPIKGDLYYTSLAFSPDGTTFAIAAPNGRVSIRNLKGEEVQSFSIPAPVSITTLTYAPDGQQIILGSWNGRIFLYDVEGKRTRKGRLSFKGHNEIVRSVDISPDGKYLLSSSNDHTLKLWSQEGKEIATLFTLNEGDWVITTPSGLFDATPGAMEKMYFVQDLDLIELEQLKERYYEPGLLSKLMSDEVLRSAETFGKLSLYPDAQVRVEQDLLHISLTERSGGIGKVSVFVNHKEVRQDANSNKETSLRIPLKQFTKYYIPGENLLSIRVYNAAGWLKSAAIEQAYTPPPTTQLGSGKASLYTIAIGTSDYNGEKLDLQFASADAAAMATAVSSSGKQLFNDQVYTHLLVTGAAAEQSPSKIHIEQTFRDIAAKAQPQDIVLVFLSGHGVTYGEAEKANFYYLTKDIASEDLSDPEIRNNFAISDDELTKWMNEIRALKQVMIVDACNSGKVVENLELGRKALNSTQIIALDRMKDRTGMYVLSGSAANKSSFEATQFGQGLLTYSLLTGMRGGIIQQNEAVDIMKLFQFSRDEVPKLAKQINGIQTPMLAFPGGGASFDIGIVTPEVEIPIGQEIPRMVPSMFLDSAEIDDWLDISTQLNKLLQDYTRKKGKGKLMYTRANVRDEQAYSIRGLYAVKGEELIIKGKLRKGQKVIHPFEIAGQKAELNKLVRKIMGEVHQKLQ